MTSVKGINISKLHHDPRARGVPNIIMRPLIYNGWRTILYSPVVITFWSVVTSMIEDAKAFSLKARKSRKNPAITRMSPRMTM